MSRQCTPKNIKGIAPNHQALGTLGEAYAARRYGQETNLAMKGVLGGGEGATRYSRA